MPTRKKVLYGKDTPVSISTGKTASAAVVTKSGAFHGLLIKADGTNDITINVYDNASAASGTKLIPTDTVFDGTVKINSLSLAPPVHFANGLYLEITVAGGGTLLSTGISSVSRQEILTGNPDF